MGLATSFMIEALQRWSREPRDELPGSDIIYSSVFFQVDSEVTLKVMGEIG